jgi:hypothetical protein
VPGSRIKESPVMAKSAVPEEPRQHGQGARRESLIDEWFLPFECLDRGTTGQRVFAGRRIGNLRKEFADCPQPFGLPAVPAVQRLAQNELPVRAGAKIDHVAPRSRGDVAEEK